jgi:hypothetical protein
MKKVKTLLLGLVLVSLMQGQTTKWFLGNGSGLAFAKTGTPPQWQSAGFTYNAGGWSYGAATSVTDPNGNLLFFTDGRALMTPGVGGAYAIKTSGQGTQLLGNPTSTQSAIAIPLSVAGDLCSHYLVFTTEDADIAAANGSTNGVSITLVNMTGIAPNYNTTITAASSASIFNTSNFTEKLCATTDGTGGYWIAIHGYDADGNAAASGGDQFFFFHIAANFYTNNSGSLANMKSTLVTNITGFPNISSTSGYVRSTIGAVHTYVPGDLHFQAKGQMKFNRAGSKLALALNGTNGGEVEVYDFNKSTGNLTTYATYNFASFHSTLGYSRPYGIEFSPNISNQSSANFLYISESTYDPYDANHIYQCNLSNTAALPVIVKSSSQTPGAIGSYTAYAGNNIFGSLQLGMDNRIYIVKSDAPYLAAINYPDALHSPTSGSGSACGYINNYLPITTWTFYGFCGSNTLPILQLPSVISGTPSCFQGIEPTPLSACNCGG